MTDTGPSVLFRRAEVDGRLVDVRCADGVITEVGEPGRATRADVVLDAAGAALVPGLHDHHIHLLALGAARTSLDVRAQHGASQFDAVIGRAAVGSAWLRVVGYHESVHGPLDRGRLDALAPRKPVRVQHRSGAMWVLSSAGLELTDLERMDHAGVERDDGGEATGRLFGLDDVLRDRVDGGLPDVGAIGQELAGYGVTGVTDLTPTDDPAELDMLAATVLATDFPVRVVVTGGPRLPPHAGGELARGPVKLVVADHRLPTVDELVADFRRARAVGRPVAVHCASRVALVLALAAWEDVGPMPGDRVEHGAVVPVELIDTLRDLRLVVVTQPSFVAERGDQYVAEVDADDVPHLWRCRSLLDGGVGVAGSTDAPYGSANPWHAIAAASQRRAPSGTIIGPAERLDARHALALFLTAPHDPAGPPRRVAVGAPADLCLLTQPLADALVEPATATVAATHGRAGLST